MKKSKNDLIGMSAENLMTLFLALLRFCIYSTVTCGLKIYMYSCIMNAICLPFTSDQIPLLLHVLMITYRRAKTHTSLFRRRLYITILTRLCFCFHFFGLYLFTELSMQYWDKKINSACCLKFYMLLRYLIKHCNLFQA